ncbi:protein toll-like [Littorina saxatilis]|uniref:protein toll-like n=1 Tax=Littorina saxatilis TaxID=31220 RepID=UPI0038B60C7C
MTTHTILLLTLTTLVSLMVVKSDITPDHDDVCMKRRYTTSKCTFNCCWRFDTKDLVKLNVSVNCSSPADSHVINALSNFNPSPTSCVGYHLYHIFGCLTAIPDNYCHYHSNTRAISLYYNSISDFPDLRCLPLLGKLNLRHNNLEGIPSYAFNGLTKLREIDLSHNEIAHIHPKAFESCCPLIRLYLDHNKLITIEASVMGQLHPFCSMRFNNNLITNISNTNNFQLKKTVKYGPGYVKLSHNRFTRGPKDVITAVGIKSIFEIGRLMEWVFDFRYNPLHCDCSVFEIALAWKHIIRKGIRRTHLNTTCVTPARFTGVSVYRLPLDQLTCNVSAGCPRKCLCENSPYELAIVVTCKVVGLTSFPEVMPKGPHLKLRMTNNSFSTLPPRQYLSRAVSIDLRNNSLSVIDRSVPHLLRNAKRVDLRDNNLMRLPETMQALSPEALFLDLHTLTCSCDLKWFPVWLQYSDDHTHLNNITCTKPPLDERILLLNATEEDLGCFQNTNDLAAYELALIITSISLLALAVLLVVFRHELVVEFHHLVARKKGYQQIANRRYQVFVSVNADSHEDSQWVRDVLLPALDHHGLASYLPPRDSVPGSVEMDDVTKGLHHSAAAITVVSPEYVDSGPCLFQFSQAYSHMVVGRHGPLLVFRLCPVSRMATREPRLRAMLTLRMFYATNIGNVKRAVAKLVATLSDVQDNAEKVELDG